MRFYVSVYSDASSLYPDAGQSLLLCVDEAGNLIGNFEIEQPPYIVNSTSLHPCYPIGMTATQDGFIYTINSAGHGFDSEAFRDITVFNESIYKYDQNGFKRAFNVDYTPYPRFSNGTSDDTNRFSFISNSGNDKILIGMNTDSFISESTYNNYLIAVDATGATLWSKSAPTPLYYSLGEPADVYAYESYFASNPTVNPLRMSVVDITVDGSGNIYVLTSMFLEKLNSSGTLQWRRWLNGSTGCCIIGSYIYVYVDNPNYYDTDGYTKLWYLPPEEYGYSKITKWATSDGALVDFETFDNLGLDSNANYVFRTEYGASGGVSLYSDVSSYVEITDAFSLVQSVAYLQPGAQYAKSKGIFKIASDGTLFAIAQQSEPLPIIVSADPTTTNWTLSVADHPVSGYEYQFTACALIEDEETPQIPIPVFLATPGYTGDRYVSLPALAMPVSLKAPRAITDLSLEKIPSAAITYKMTLDNGTDTISIPLSSLSVRYYSDGVNASVVCPAVTISMIQSIDAIGDCEMIISRGHRFPDGELILSELVRGDLQRDDTRYDMGANSSSITLTATGIAESPYSERQLKGISYKSEIGGKRRVRCALDTYLRPGGIAIISDSESMIVGSITYTASITQESMEVIEAS